MHAVHDRVLEFIDDPASASFEQLALAVFAHQYSHCEPYRRYCLRRGRTPDSVSEWRDIPAVPVQAFQHAELCCGPPQKTFLSTGTTAGPAHRSRHQMPDLRLYHRSAVTGLRCFLFPDVEELRVISLIPPAEAQPDSSLAQMATWAIEEFGDDGSTYAVYARVVDFEKVVVALREVEHSGQPACLLTTTGALIRFLDLARNLGVAFRLPHGSRLMDTGGDKGAPRSLSRKGMLHACWNTFAIPGYFCVNEYGMAELSSQYYDSVIRDRIDGRQRGRRKIGPHWVRTLVVDPASLAPAEPSAAGLLCHFDLANAGTAMAVLSEDLGRWQAQGFQLLGRAPGAAARGCSMSAAEWETA